MQSRCRVQFFVCTFVVFFFTYYHNTVLALSPRFSLCVAVEEAVLQRRKKSKVSSNAGTNQARDWSADL